MLGSTPLINLKSNPLTVTFDGRTYQVHTSLDFGLQNYLLKRMDRVNSRFIGIVAMAILQAWFYQRTRSVFLAIIIHAAFNTLPLTIVLLFEGSPAAVLANLLLWAVVIVLKSRTDREARAADTDATT